MITAEEKREQMGEDYWLNSSLKQINEALTEVDPNLKRATFNLHIPSSLRNSVMGKIEVVLEKAGYKVKRLNNQNDFNHSLLVKWAD